MGTYGFEILEEPNQVVIEKSVQDTVILVCAMMSIAYGFFSVLRPDRIREHYLSNFNLDTPSKWHSPWTWLNKRPGLLPFRIYGPFLLDSDSFS